MNATSFAYQNLRFRIAYWNHFEMRIDLSDPVAYGHYYLSNTRWSSLDDWIDNIIFGINVPDQVQLDNETVVLFCGFVEAKND